MQGVFQRRLLTGAALFTFSLLLRAWRFPTLGLTHFDEGVYAISGFWSLHSQALYPWQRFFAPPGYFGLVGIAYWLSGGASDLAAIAPSILFGAATPVLIWWIGSRSFGTRCGLFAALLTATSEFNIVFSRTALADTAFTFFFVLSLALIAKYFEKGFVGLGIVAGLSAGASWNLKYHGWMPLAIAALTLLLNCVPNRVATRFTALFLLRWTLVSTIAFLCFLPWLLYVNSLPGGYLAVERFHRQFADLHWATNFVRYAQMVFWFDGWISRISPALLFLIVIFTAKNTSNGSRFRWGFLALLVSGVAIGGVATAALLAVAGGVIAWRSKNLLGMFMACTFAVFTFVTPFYTPYARLLLPWVAVSQFLAGISIDHYLRSVSPRQKSSGNFVDIPFEAGALVATSLVVMLIAKQPIIRENAWRPTFKTRMAGQELIHHLRAGTHIAVDQEPNLAFYFLRAGFPTICINQLSQIAPGNVPIILIAGEYARQTPDWQPVPHSGAYDLQLSGKVPSPPSDIRLLDDLSPRDARDFVEHPTGQYDLEIYRLTPRNP